MLLAAAIAILRCVQTSKQIHIQVIFYARPCVHTRQNLQHEFNLYCFFEAHTVGSLKPLLLDIQKATFTNTESVDEHRTIVTSFPSALPFPYSDYQTGAASYLLKGTVSLYKLKRLLKIYRNHLEELRKLYVAAIHAQLWLLFIRRCG